MTIRVLGASSRIIQSVHSWRSAFSALAPMYSIPIRRRALVQLSPLFPQSSIKARAGIATSFVPSISPTRRLLRFNHIKSVTRITTETSIWQEEVENIRNAIWDVTNICRSCALLICIPLLLKCPFLTKSQSTEKGGWERSRSQQRTK